jgi:uncharacterized protein YndB with AHSA1/START domain
MATAIYHQVWINAPLAKVYEAISTTDGLGSWWDKPKITKTDTGPVLEFNPGVEHGVLRAKMLGMIQDKRVEWEFISIHPQSSPASAGRVHTSFSRSL